jgi:hypothetical protein
MHEIDNRKVSKVRTDPFSPFQTATRFCFSSSIFAALLLVATLGYGADLYWDVNGAAVGAGGPSPSGIWGTGTASNFTIDPNGQTGVNVSVAATDNIHFSAGGDATGAYTVTMGGSRSVSSIFFEEGTVTLNPNASGQTLTIASGSTITNTSDNLATINTNILGTTALSVLGTSNVSFARVASATTNFTMTIGAAGDNSTRTVTLNESSGDTASRTNTNLAVVVNSGTLLVNRSAAFNAAPNGVTVNNTGTTFGGVGLVGAVSVNAGAILNPGLSGPPGTSAAVGTLNTGALTLNPTSLSNFDVSGVSNYDRLLSSSSLTLGGTLDLNIASGLNFSSGQILNLFSGTSRSGTFTGIADGQVVSFDGYSFTADYTSTGFDLVAVPEPSTWAAGLLALAAVGFTQRKRLGVALARKSAATAS